MSAAAALRDSQRQIVIIDSDPARVLQAHEAGLVALEGDASQDEILHEALVWQKHGESLSPRVKIH